MLRADYRSAYVIAVAAGLGLGTSATVTTVTTRARAQNAPDGDVKASMQCDRASEPGRVRCTVETRIEGGRTLTWADVEILSLPDFASALKGRIGPQDAVARDDVSAKWALGLVARRAGQGEVRARVRVVACDAPHAGGTSGGTSGGTAPTPPPARCVPVTVEVKAQVTVSG
jgi:hypothetical protein